MKSGGLRLIQTAKIGYLMISGVLCVIGIYLLVSSEETVRVLVNWVGFICVLSGGIRILGYFSKDLFRLAFQYDFEFGLFLSITGILMLMFSVRTIQIATILLGLAVLMDGILRIRVSLEAKRFGIRQWWGVLILAVAACAAGTVLIFGNLSAWSLFGTIVGMACLMDGLLNIAVALSAVKIVRHQIPDGAREPSEKKRQAY